MSRTYATVEDLGAYLAPDPLPDGAARLLRDASLEVDEMLLTAHYRVDEAGMPTDPRVIEAIRDATCAQAAHRAEYGDDVEVLEGVEPVSLGPLSLGGSRRMNEGSGIPQQSPKAVRVLRVAGLIPGGISDG